jgi:TPR repeat protein
MHVRLPKAIVLSSLLLFCLLLTAACGGPALFTQQNEASWEKLCPPESAESRALPLHGECNARVITLTAEAACAAEDNLGCFLAAAWYEEEESPLYDHDRAVELSEYACEKGDPAACYAHAWVLFQGDIYEQGRAYNLMRRTCLEGMGMSCHRIGTWYQHEPDSPKEMRLAAGFFKRSCDQGFPVGCREFANVYEEGFGVARNQERADQLYDQACDMGDRESCLEVERNAPHNEEDMWSEYLGVTNEQYISMYKTACENGFKHACTRAGLSIELGDVRGRYISRNYDRAAKFYREGCKRGAAVSCWALARLVREGAGTIEANTKDATDLAKKACDAGLDLGCTQYRDYRYRLWDEKRASKFATQCEGGDGKSCYLAGRAFNYGVNFSRDSSRALELLEKGCELDYYPACENAGIYYAKGYGTRTNPQKAAEFYKRACDGGTGHACFALAIAHLEGDGAEEDPTKALELAELACKRDEGEACVFAGLRYENGMGAEQDDEKARDYYKDGCSWRMVRACTKYGSMWRDGRGGEEDDEVARRLFARSCANDDGDACFELAEMLEAGEGDEDLGEEDDPEEEADPIKAADHYEMACLVGHGQGCAELARLHREGKGVRKDVEKASMLQEKACMEGHEDSCPEDSEPSDKPGTDESTPQSAENEG